MKFQILPINSRFKRLIHDHGKDWVALSEPRPMHCFGGEIGVTGKSLDDPAKVSNFRLKEIEGKNP